MHFNSAVFIGSLDFHLVEVNYYPVRSITLLEIILYELVDVTSNHIIIVLRFSTLCARPTFARQLICKRSTRRSFILIVHYILRDVCTKATKIRAIKQAQCSQILVSVSAKLEIVLDIFVSGGLPRAFKM